MEIDEKIVAEAPQPEPGPADPPRHGEGVVPPPLAGEGDRAPHGEGGTQDASSTPPTDEPAEPDTAAQTPPRGRPWVRGQSGNPRGRPSRAHKAAYVAHAMLDRKTEWLVDKVIGWGQGSDKTMLRLFTQKMVPPRHEVPVWLNIPSIEGLRLVKLFNELYCHL